MRQDGFVVQVDEPNHEITVGLRWFDDADLESIQKALTNAYATAFGELAKRYQEVTA